MAEHHWSEGLVGRSVTAGLPRKGGRCDEALDGNAVMDTNRLALAGHRLRGLPGSRDRGVQLGFQLEYQSAGDPGRVDLSGPFDLGAGHHGVEPGQRDLRR